MHVYALDDLAERAVTPVGLNADNVRSDGTNKVYVGFGPDEGAGGLAIYDAAAHKKVGEIVLASRPESFQFDLRPDRNRIFVNLPGQSWRTTTAASDLSIGPTAGRWRFGLWRERHGISRWRSTPITTASSSPVASRPN